HRNSHRACPRCRGGGRRPGRPRRWRARATGNGRAGGARRHGGEVRAAGGGRALGRHARRGRRRGGGPADSPWSPRGRRGAWAGCRARLEEVMEIRKSVIEGGDRLYDRWNRTAIRAAYENSARNLAYYMAFRKMDLRKLQERLIPWGVSSLGRLEADVLGTLN